VAGLDYRAVCSGLNIEIVGSNPAEGMDVCVLFVMGFVGSGLCDGLITRSEETYDVCVDVILCGLETSQHAAQARLGLHRYRRKQKIATANVI